MKPSHTIRPVFDDPNLVSAAGLVPALRLAESAGFHDLLGGLSVPAANAGAKAASVVGGMLAGFPGAGPVGEQLLGAAEVGGSRASEAGEPLANIDAGRVGVQERANRLVEAVIESIGPGHAVHCAGRDDAVRRLPAAYARSILGAKCGSNGGPRPAFAYVSSTSVTLLSPRPSLEPRRGDGPAAPQPLHAPRWSTNRPPSPTP